MNDGCRVVFEVLSNFWSLVSVMNSPHSKRRKTLDDYFGHPAKRSQPARPNSQAAENNTSVPPGLSIIPDFVTIKEQTRLLAFLDSQEWRTDLSRRTMHYGGTYCLMPPKSASPAERAATEKNVITAPPIPNEMGWLIGRMAERKLFGSEARPQYCIVSVACFLRSHSSYHKQTLRQLSANAEQQ